MKKPKPKTGKNLKAKQSNKKSSKKNKPIVKKVSNKATPKTKQQNIKGGSGANLKLKFTQKKMVSTTNQEVDFKDPKKDRLIAKNQIELARMKWEMAIMSQNGRKDRVDELFKGFNELSLKTQSLIGKN